MFVSDEISHPIREMAFYRYFKSKYLDLIESEATLC